jgi:hypothetical protein
MISFIVVFLPSLLHFANSILFLIKGLPIGAVKNSMQRDQQDPTIMDLDPDKSLDSQRPPEKIDGDGPPLKKDPAYEKYFRMLKMVSIYDPVFMSVVLVIELNIFYICKGLSVDAVKNAMQRDGLDPKIMDLDPQKPVSSQMKRDADDPPLKDDPKYNKYFKMLKMVSNICSLVASLFNTYLPLCLLFDPMQGLPLGAVKNALQRDGLDPSVMDLDPERSVASQTRVEEEIVDKDPPLKEDPAYR